METTKYQKSRDIFGDDDSYTAVIYDFDPKVKKQLVGECARYSGKASSLNFELMRGSLFNNKNQFAELIDPNGETIRVYYSLGANKQATIRDIHDSCVDSEEWI